MPLLSSLRGEFCADSSIVTRRVLARRRLRRPRVNTGPIGAARRVFSSQISLRRGRRQVGVRRRACARVRLRCRTLRPIGRRRTGAPNGVEHPRRKRRTLELDVVVVVAARAVGASTGGGRLLAGVGVRLVAVLLGLEALETAARVANSGNETLGFEYRCRPENSGAA